MLSLDIIWASSQKTHTHTQKNIWVISSTSISSLHFHFLCKFPQSRMMCQEYPVKGCSFCGSDGLTIFKIENKASFLICDYIVNKSLKVLLGRSPKGWAEPCHLQLISLSNQYREFLRARQNFRWEGKQMLQRWDVSNLGVYSSSRKSVRTAVGEKICEVCALGRPHWSLFCREM